MLPLLLDLAKFKDVMVTAKGEQRAHVALKSLETLWFNTGTLCNIACLTCYIESSPRNDALSYLTLDEVTAYLDEIAALAGKDQIDDELAEMKRALGMDDKAGNGDKE